MLGCVFWLYDLTKAITLKLVVQAVYMHLQINCIEVKVLLSEDFNIICEAKECLVFQHINCGIQGYNLLIKFGKLECTKQK